MSDDMPAPGGSTAALYAARREAVELRIAALSSAVQALALKYRRCVEQYGRTQARIFGDLAAVEEYVTDLEFAFQREKAAGHITESWRTGV